MRKLTYDEVRKVFEDGGCELLSEGYEGFNSKLEYKCICGYVSLITLTNFGRGHRCVKCSREKVKEKLKFS